MKTLTDQQRKVLQCVETYSAANGFPPTLREIGQAVGISNVNAVRGHVAALEKKGYVAKAPDKARSIRVLHSPSAFSRLKRKLHDLARTDEGVTHKIVYGLAWTTPKRTPCLAGRAAKRLADAFEAEAARHGWTMLDVRIQPDHVVAVVKVWPNHSAAQAVRRLQAAGSALRGRQRQGFPDGKLWARGYVATTDLEILDRLVSELLDQRNNRSTKGGRPP